MSGSRAPRVTFGVPVYKGVGLVEETLRQVVAQTFTDFEVLISVDGADMESADACRAFAALRRDAGSNVEDDQRFDDRHDRRPNQPRSEAARSRSAAASHYAS